MFYALLFYLMIYPQQLFPSCVPCRLLHLSLLLFNTIAVRSVSAITGGSKSVFSKEENALAYILVASQVKTKSLFSCQFLRVLGNLGSNHMIVGFFNSLCNLLNCHSFQKTLPVMVAVIEPLGGALGESGLLILPCVAAHLNQVINVFSIK